MDTPQDRIAMIASLADSLIVVDEQAERIADLERQLAEARVKLHKQLEISSVTERQLADARKEVVLISGLIATYLIAIYDVPIRQVDCRMSVEDINSLHDEIIDVIGQKYIDAAMKEGE